MSFASVSRASKLCTARSTLHSGIYSTHRGIIAQSAALHIFLAAMIFSTLYTNIPHDSSKYNLSELINSGIKETILVLILCKKPYMSIYGITCLLSVQSFLEM